MSTHVTVCVYMYHCGCGLLAPGPSRGGQIWGRAVETTHSGEIRNTQQSGVDFWVLVLKSIYVDLAVTAVIINTTCSVNEV